MEVRGADGLWTVPGRPWQGASEVRDRTAEEVAAELIHGFMESAQYPGDEGFWRIRVWWHEEGDPAGAKFRLVVGPDAPVGTPS